MAHRETGRTLMVLREAKIDETTGSLETSIRSELDALPTFSFRRCIYKVPEPLRAVKPEAYTPSMVSIGPYHRKNPELLPMEIHKLKFLSTFLHASRENGDLGIYLQYIKDNETLIREYYADPIADIKSDEFIKMVLVDAVFIIELFRSNSGMREPRVDNFIFNRPYFINRIIPGISLAENQLPFFVLRDLYTMAFMPNINNRVPRFTDIARKFYEVDRNCIPNYLGTRDRDDSFTPMHLLDLLRRSYLPSKRREEVIINIGNDDPVGMILCPSVTRLREAGIKFQVAMDPSNSLHDILFDEKEAVLTFPKLIISDRTELHLRNMIAFEQCHYNNQPYISEYEFLMDCLIDTCEDVDLLVENGIIENWLGSSREVSDLFNNLGKQVIMTAEKYYYAGLTLQLKAHCNKHWNVYRATLNHTYFRHPWAVVSVIYAALLLILTIIQVVTGILSVV